jgi:hypothetical protein
VAPSGRQARTVSRRALAATVVALLVLGTLVASGPTVGATVAQDATGTTTTSTTTTTVDAEARATTASGDEFDSANIDLDTWTLSDPTGRARVSVTDGVLEAALPADSEAWLPEDRAVRLIQAVDDISSDLELELVAPPAALYDSVGFFMGDPQDVWQRIDLVAGPDGLRLFAASFLMGFPRVRINEPVPDDSRFLAVRRVGHAQTVLVSPDGEAWTTVATFVNPVPVGNVGIGFGSRQPGEEPFRVEAFRVDGEDPMGPGPDVQAPLVQDVTTERTESGILIRWVTDETAISGVEWGRTTDYEFGSLPSEGRIKHELLLPGLDAGVTYHFRVIAADALGNASIGDDQTGHFAPAGRPFIDAWYGDRMVFGPNGTPQRFLNVVGNVSDEDGIVALTYTLDGGEPIPLDLGPDDRRLVAPGDFNAEVPVDGLTPGPHEVRFRAEDGAGSTSTRTVQLEWAPPDTPPTLPIETDWASADSVTDWIQVVDGKWTIEDGMLRNLDIGYDRVFTIGDRSLTDYEVTFPFVLHRIDKEGYNTISGTPAMGFTLGWTGHYAVGNETPFWGYWPSTGTASFVWDSVDEASLKVAGNDDAPQAYTPGVRLPLETPLRLRARVERIDDGSRISMRAWADGTEEPDGWAVSVVEDDGPEAGSIAVVAHHVDVSFGDIVVQEKR